MLYNFKINDFEGPLDLLLHLIKQSNIDICDIEIVSITDQYLNFLKQMETLNLDIASDYLVMAAELIEMKSKTLLPVQEKEEEPVEELRQNLITRLIEYQQYQALTPAFKALAEQRSQIYTKEPANLKEYVPEGYNLNANEYSIDALLNAFSDVANRAWQRRPLPTKVTNKEISIPEQMIRITEILKSKPEVFFEELFEEYEKSYCIINFLAILEMAKKGEIIITQNDNFNKIIVKLNEVL